MNIKYSWLLIAACLAFAGCGGSIAEIDDNELPEGTTESALATNVTIQGEWLLETYASGPIIPTRIEPLGNGSVSIAWKDGATSMEELVRNPRKSFPRAGTITIRRRDTDGRAVYERRKVTFDEKVEIYSSNTPDPIREITLNLPRTATREALRLMIHANADGQLRSAACLMERVSSATEFSYIALSIVSLEGNIL